MSVAVRFRKNYNMSLVSVCDYEKQAEGVLAKRPWDYYRSGAGDEYTLKLNKDAFNK